MFILKCWFHICMHIRYLFFKAIYGNRFCAGKHTTWRKGFSVMINKGATIFIGKDCFFNNYCSINALHSIVIGDGTIMGENVKIYDHNHKFGNINIPLKEQGYSIGKVTIGNNCWIGSNVVILKDVTIGDNVTVAAGTVVARSIPSCKLAKNKSSIEYIDILTK